MFHDRTIEQITGEHFETRVGHDRLAKFMITARSMRTCLCNSPMDAIGGNRIFVDVAGLDDSATTAGTPPAR
jgi:hypothetical protein